MLDQTQQMKPLCMGSYSTPTETSAVYVACKYAKGRYQRKGLCRLAYIVIGELNLHPLHIYHQYRLRFGIETSYRLMNLVRVRTTSKSSGLGLLYVDVALTRLNLWVFIKWTCVTRPRRGADQVLHHLQPLARWRLWLWEVVKLQYGNLGPATHDCGLLTIRVAYSLPGFVSSAGWSGL